VENSAQTSLGSLPLAFALPFTLGVESLAKNALLYTCISLFNQQVGSNYRHIKKFIISSRAQLSLGRVSGGRAEVREQRDEHPAVQLQSSSVLVPTL